MNIQAHVADFLQELEDLERKYGVEIDHHAEYIGLLRDRTTGNVLATLRNDSIVDMKSIVQN